MEFEDFFKGFTGKSGQSNILNLANDLTNISVKAKEIADRCEKIINR